MKSRFNLQKMIIWLVLALIIFFVIYVMTFDIELTPEPVSIDITSQVVK